ncbi:MAG: SGNH/GDSL hydrolase family protein [Rubrobacter sp.]|nr:SGNH/GDSL hydrolase family protein [Rubrobacter sp.]
MAFRKLILLFIAVILALASCASDESSTTYVSLGDSLAVGVGASDPGELGYTPLFRESLAEETGDDVRLVRLGLSGETSGSFIGAYPDGDSQLVRAEEAVGENPGTVATLSLGGNDLVGAGDTDAEREAAIVRYGQNLDYILGVLENASEPPPRVTVLALYNPAPGSFTDEWTGRLNAEIRAVADRHDTVSVADGDRAFEGNEEEYARHSEYPWDIHPTDAGYRALAEAFEEARFARGESGAAR